MEILLIVNFADFLMSAGKAFHNRGTVCCRMSGHLNLPAAASTPGRVRPIRPLLRVSHGAADL